MLLIFNFLLKLFCDGRRDYNSSFQTNIQVVEAVIAQRSVIKMDELKPGTKYIVYVKATTVEGDGVGSDPVILQTPSKGIHEQLDLISREDTHFFPHRFSLEQPLMLYDFKRRNHR